MTTVGNSYLDNKVSVVDRRVNEASRFPAFKRRLLILGAGHLAKDLCQVLLSKGFGSTKIVGFLDKDANRVGEKLVNPGIIGTYEQLFEIVEHHNIGAVAVCVEDRRTVLPVQALLDIKALGVEVIDGHQLYEQESGRLSIDLLKPSALIFSSGFRRRTLAMGLKRCTDLAIAMVGLILLSPFFILIACIIKVDSPGPVFYKQLRVGLRGQPYMIWKFRSMHKDSESEGPRWALDKDPRISRSGRILRKLRIDELPQLINVIKGEMSLVGPRPERPIFVQELRKTIPYYDMRHTVKPGITGWAQTQFRYGASAEDAHKKLQFDLYYVKNLSFFLDTRILIETIKVALFGEGAR